MLIRAIQNLHYLGMGLLVCWAAMVTLDPQGEQLLYRKALEQGRDVTVTKGAHHAPAGLRGLVDPRLLEAATGAYTIRIQIEREGERPVLIASYLHIETELMVGVTTLDVLVESGQIAVAMIEGPDLALWMVPIDVGKSATWTVLSPGGWSVAAPLRPLDPKHIKVKLLRHSNGRTRAEVTDLRKSDATPAIYEQVDSQWQLVGAK